ncbi:hypothetical protein [Desulfovibrio sp. An276]|uniref:hypothetical protein n=1 Tax=Desulfovibrio sp. An276 TaxID=1965618 RepID=UPI0013A66874|nr:hypothetical protein [Desulfovibrio sp. An276]
MAYPEKKAGFGVERVLAEKQARMALCMVCIAKLYTAKEQCLPSPQEKIFYCKYAMHNCKYPLSRRERTGGAQDGLS